MKKLFIILLSALSLTAFAQQKKVAVYVTGEQSGIKKILADKLVETITYSNRYIAIERTASFLAELSKEQKYQREGAVDDNEISRLGKQFGVQYVCAVDVIEEFGQKYITARLIDVETAEVITIGNANSELASMEDLLECANSVANNITGKTAQELAEEEAEWEKEKAKRQQAWEEWEQTVLKNFQRDYMIVGDYMITRPIGPCGSKSNITWDKIPDVIKTCRAGGYSDWRIPSAYELKFIYQELEELDGKATLYRVETGINSPVESKIKEYKNKGYFDWIENQYGIDAMKNVKYHGDKLYMLSLMLIRTK